MMTLKLKRHPSEFQDPRKVDHRPWCVSRAADRKGDAHICFGPEHRSPLSGQPAVEWSDGIFRPPCITVEAVDVAMTGPLVHIGPGELSPWCQLTPADTAALIDSLTTALAEIAEGQTR